MPTDAQMVLIWLRQWPPVQVLLGGVSHGAETLVDGALSAAQLAVP